jgi:hypothetical protein
MSYIVGRKVWAKLTARGLAEDGDLISVTAKMPNVISNPLNRESLVTKPGILRAFRLESIGLCKPEDYANSMSATLRNPT